MRKIILLTAANIAILSGCIYLEQPAHADTVRLGQRNYAIDDGDESTNMNEAQAFCQRLGYAFASLDYTRYEPSLGHMFSNHDTTRFYCLNNGESKPPLIANDYNITIRNR
jgi:hypothetical protein